MKRSIDEIQLRQSTSLFRKVGQEALNINIVETTDISDILTNIEKDADEKHDLTLTDYDKARILTCDIDDSLNNVQSKFIRKLRYVIVNDMTDTGKTHLEKYIDELATLLYDVFDFDDGNEFIMKPSDLYLKIGNEKFASHADREGVKDNKYIWILQENKLAISKTYLHGDVQLACSMIAAAQYNESMLSALDKDYKILGLKFVGEDINFCSSIISKEYLEELIDGLPKTHYITLIKYKPLSFSSPRDRSDIIRLFKSMRKDALE